MPRMPQGNNRENNKWYEDEYYKAVFTNLYGDEQQTRDAPSRNKSEDGWRKSGVKHDIYHLPKEGEDYVEDDYTVGQKFEDRTQFIH